MTITEFLEARIAEDEALAFAANAWASHGGPTQWIGQPGDRLVGRLGEGGPHIAAWSPARVLAECAAKRAIVGFHRRIVDIYDEALGDTCTMCADSGPEAQSFPCSTLRHLAAVYADHPDYQPGWAA